MYLRQSAKSTAWLSAWDDQLQFQIQSCCGLLAWPSWEGRYSVKTHPICKCPWSLISVLECQLMSHQRVICTRITHLCSWGCMRPSWKPLIEQSPFASIGKTQPPTPTPHQSTHDSGVYHSIFEITYSGFILGEFNFVIISAKITAQNSVSNYFCNFPCFLQISVLRVAAATDSKPGRVEDPLFLKRKPSLGWPPIRSVCRDGPLAGRTTTCYNKKLESPAILTVHVAKNPAFWPCGSQTILVIPAFWPSGSQKTPGNPSFLTVACLSLSIVTNPKNSSILPVWFTRKPHGCCIVTVWFTKKSLKFRHIDCACHNKSS